MHLGEIVYQYRKENGLSMDEFAKKSGLSKGYISMLEKNENPQSKKEIVPSLETINQVAGVIGVDLDTLLNQLGRNQKVELSTIENIIPNTEKKMVVLARSIEKLPEEDREKIMQNFEDTIDIYLKARGIKGGK